MHRLAIVSLLLASACVGQIEVELPPEPPIENPPPPPPPSTDVAMTVREAGAPVPGVTVIFQAADDTVIGEAQTDAAGVATVAMPSGGTVTVVRRTPDGNGVEVAEAFTYAGVKPGDRLELARPTARPGAPVAVTITLPATNTAYQIRTACGEGIGVGTAQLELVGCGAETDFFVTELGGEGGSFLARAAVAPAIDFSLVPVLGDRETTLQATNLPADLTVSLDKRLHASGFELFRSAATPAPEQKPTPVPDIGTAVADQLVTALLVNPVDGRSQLVANRQPYSNGTSTVDILPNVIPFVSDPMFDGTTVSWTQDGLGAADFAVVTFDNGAGVVHRIAAPLALGATSVRVPVLPASAGVTLAGAQVAHSIVKVAGGYDAARARVFGGSLLDAAPMTSHIAVSASSTRLAGGDEPGKQ